VLDVCLVGICAEGTCVKSSCATGSYCCPGLGCYPCCSDQQCGLAFKCIDHKCQFGN
jgi:hypothetical protein